ncbi:GAF domain-containing protein [Patescibacteria group bacterium]
MRNNVDIAQKVNEALIGTLDFDELAKKVTKMFINELDLQGGAVFRIDREQKHLKACAFAIQGNMQKLAQIMGKPFSSMTTPIDKPINYMGKTAAFGKIYRETDLSKFIIPVVSKSVSIAITKLSGANYLLSLPIRSGTAIVGALLVGKKDCDFTETEITAMKAFTDQLGLAMGNVMAHERIIEQYKKSLEEKGKPKKKRPNIKFTLRVTDDLEQYLNFKTLNTKKSKAEYVRDLLAEQMKTDDDFRKFNKE